MSNFFQTIYLPLIMQLYAIFVMPISAFAKEYKPFQHPLYRSQKYLLETQSIEFWQSLEDFFSLSEKDPLYISSAYRMMEIARHKKLNPPSQNLPQGIVELYIIKTYLLASKQNIQYQTTLMAHVKDPAILTDIQLSSESAGIIINREHGYWAETPVAPQLKMITLNTPTSQNPIEADLYKLKITTPFENNTYKIILDNPSVSPSEFPNFQPLKIIHPKEQIGTSQIHLTWQDYKSIKYQEANDERWIQIDVFNLANSPPIWSRLLKSHRPNHIEINLLPSIRKGTIQTSFFEQSYYGKIKLLREARVLNDFNLDSQK